MRYLHLSTIFFCLLIASTIYSQQRAILHIGADGNEEIVLLNYDSDIREVVRELEQEKQENQKIREFNTFGIIDTISHYPELLHETMFRFEPQNIAFQWFGIGAELDILGIMWYIPYLQSELQQAEVRVWRADPRLYDLPNNAVNSLGHLGYYEIDCDTCNYEITAFKEEAGSGLLIMDVRDTTHLFFDPLGVEWLAGRTKVTMNTDEWQTVNFNDELSMKALEPFGFTIQNITKVTEPDSFIWIESSKLPEFNYTEFFNPYHSIKFYTHPFGEDSTIGWKIRNYEFDLYVIVDLIQDGPYVDFYFLDDEKVIPSEMEKEISIVLDDHHEENPRFPEVRMVEATLKYKIDFAPVYQEVPAIISGDTLYAVLPPFPVYREIIIYAVVYDDMGNRHHTQVESYSTISGIKDQSVSPSHFRLGQNYPNPFNPNTMINYQLSMISDVELGVYNTLGQKVATLVSGRQAAGRYHVEWNASNFSSGIYYYQLVAGEYVETKKMVLLK